MRTGKATRDGVPSTVTWGLLAVFVLHDLEELVTMPSWLSARVARLRRSHPDAPPVVWKILDPGPAHTAAAIGMMGVVVAAAAAAGARTRGRSDFFQTTLAGFGLHALMHLGQSAAARGYTPGVATAPALVAPFSWWAWRQLGR
ncbi:MAG: HXXEE domain-containing protein, partial [Actinomycetia bacterium]|nr:HXXEE domain-containing protein [Actinomycetes bacterium]